MKSSYELRVGMFTLIAMVMVMGGWGWLKSVNLFKPVQRIVVRFHDVAGLTNNATVNINGVRVGLVEKIDLIGKGQVDVHIKITDDSLQVVHGSSFTIQTLGLVGAKYVEISLPELPAGETLPSPIQPDEIVIGQDPVRAEIVFNTISTKLMKLIQPLSSDKAAESLSRVLEDSGDTVKNINLASEKFNKVLDRVDTAVGSVSDTSKNFGSVAKKLDKAANNADQFVASGTQAFKGVTALTSDLQGTSQRMNKLLDTPGLSTDLKETMRLAKQTAETVSETIKDVNTTFKDDDKRKDMIAMLSKINDSTQNIHQSMLVLSKMSGDQELRGDVKQILASTKDAVTKLDNLVNEPTFKTDVAKTMQKVKVAAEDVDVAAKQLRQILGKRAPLMHMMFGRPGDISEEELKEIDQKKVDKSDNKDKEVKDKKDDQNKEVSVMRPIGDN